MTNPQPIDPMDALLQAGLGHAQKLGTKAKKVTASVLGQIIHSATALLHRDPTNGAGPLAVLILDGEPFNQGKIKKVMVLLGNLTTGTDLEDALAELLGTAGAGSDQKPPCFVYRDNGTIEQIDLNTQLGLMQVAQLQAEGYVFTPDPASGTIVARKPQPAQPVELEQSTRSNQDPSGASNHDKSVKIYRAKLGTGKPKEDGDILVSEGLLLTSELRPHWNSGRVEYFDRV